MFVNALVRDCVGTRNRNCILDMLQKYCDKLSLVMLVKLLYSLLFMWCKPIIQ